MKLSIVIPAYNEKETIEEILKRVHEVEIPLKKEIIVVDDGSSDGTRDILKNLKDKFNLKLVFHKENKGKGGALKTGFKESSGDIILVQDADLEYNPKDYIKLISPIIKGERKVVYGSRDFLNNPHSSSFYFFGGQLLTKIFNLLFASNLTDLNTCYKVFTREVLENIKLREDDFSFCEEISCKVLKKGYKIEEVGIKYSPRTFKEGKKINWLKDGFKGLYVIIKYRFFD